jgi:prevent-host-death family protein
MVSMTVSEARAALPELLNRIEDGEEVVITRHGRAVAVVVRPDMLRPRRAADTLASADHVHELLAGAAAAPLNESSGLTAERADELIREIRSGRDSR